MISRAKDEQGKIDQKVLIINMIDTLDELKEKISNGCYFDAGMIIGSAIESLYIIFEEMPSKTGPSEEEMTDLTSNNLRLEHLLSLEREKSLHAEKLLVNFFRQHSCNEVKNDEEKNNLDKGI